MHAQSASLRRLHRVVRRLPVIPAGLRFAQPIEIVRRNPVVEDMETATANGRCAWHGWPNELQRSWKRVGVFQDIADGGGAPIQIDLVASCLSDVQPGSA